MLGLGAGVSLVPIRPEARGSVCLHRQNVPQERGGRPQWLQPTGLRNREYQLQSLMLFLYHHLSTLSPVLVRKEQQEHLKTGHGCFLVYLCKFRHVSLRAHDLMDVSYTVEPCPLLIAFSKFNLHVWTSHASHGLGFINVSVDVSSIIPVETHTPYVGLNLNHANTFH